MNDRELLARRFETHREHLRAVALGMLGSSHDADDAVQEAWLRLSRVDADTVDNLGGWLTTVVARVCLDMLRSRTRREDLPDTTPDLTATSPEDEALLADSVGLALLVVLDTLEPAERLAFVLHDMFAVPFDEIAPIVGRTPTAARQLASRARRRMRSDPAFADVPFEGVTSVADRSPAADRQRESGARRHDRGYEAKPANRRRRQEVVEAFLAASRRGDFEALVALLQPEAVLRADHAAVAAAETNRDRGAPQLEPVVHGARTVARTLVGRAMGAELALIDGTPGAVWAPGGRPRAVFAFRVVEGSIAEIDIVIDPSAVSALSVELL